MEIEKKKHFKFKEKLDNKLLGKKVNDKAEDGQARNEVKKYKSNAKSKTNAAEIKKKIPNKNTENKEEDSNKKKEE